MTNSKSCPHCRHECFHAAAVCESCGFDFIAEALPLLKDDRLRSPYPYFGTKKKVANDLWRLFGKVNRYIEPFLGSAAMLLARPQSQRTFCVANDLSRYISNFWRAVQYQPEALAKWAEWPVNEADLHARHTWLEAQPFEEFIGSTPSGEDLLERLRNLEKGLQQDPLWCDPQIAGWWVYGTACWIGGGWCSRMEGKESVPIMVSDGVTYTQSKVAIKARGNGGVLRKQLKNKNMRCDPDGDIYDEHLNAVISARRPETHNLKGVLTRHDDLLNYCVEMQSVLRETVVCCGDWSRVVTPYVLGEEEKTCAVFLDPPYRKYGSCYGRYNDEQISSRVRAWAIENGKSERLRIILCEFEGAFEMPPNWSVYSWDHDQGMSSTLRNIGRERVWCSPSIKPLDRLEVLVRIK